MLKITDENFQEYKQVLEILWKFFISNSSYNSKIDPCGETSPITVLSKWEKKSMTLAKKGLKEGLRDLIGDIIELPFEKREEINNQLAARGFLGLNQLFSIIRDTPQKVLKRGKIKNLDEYYIIKEVLADAESKITTTNQQRLWAIFVEFEDNYGFTIKG